MVHLFKNNGYNIVLDVDSGAIHVVDDISYDMIGIYEGKEKDDIFKEMKSMHPSISDDELIEVYDEIEELIKAEELFVDAILTQDVKENKQRSKFDFAKLSAKDWTTYAEPVKTQSGLMTSMAECDAFFVTQLGNGDRKEGEKVTVHPL